MKTDRPFVHFFGLLTIVALLASCAMFSGRETPGEYVDDATITSTILKPIFLASAH